MDCHSDPRFRGRTPLHRPSVYDYLDYRRYLRDALAHEKARGKITGHRDVAIFIGLKSPGHITWILQGKRNLVGNATERMAKLMGMGPVELEFFGLLIHHNDTTNPDERRSAMARISHLQSLRKVKPTAAAARYWSHWRHAVVREMIAISRLRQEDAALIAHRLHPTTTVEDAVESIQLLLDLEMIETNPEGILVRRESILSTGENWTLEAIRGFQKQILQLSIEALESMPRESREISTVTFSVSRERFLKIRNRIQEMRAEILTLIRTDPEPTEVFHLAVELFPATLESLP